MSRINWFANFEDGDHSDALQTVAVVERLDDGAMRVNHFDHFQLVELGDRFYLLVRGRARRAGGRPVGLVSDLALPCEQASGLFAWCLLGLSGGPVDLLPVLAGNRLALVVGGGIHCAEAH